MNIRIITAIFSFLLFSPLLTHAANYYAKANGNWSDNNSWYTDACGGVVTAGVGNYPGSAAGDVAVICSGITITLDVIPPNPIASLTIGTAAGNTANHGLTFGGVFTLNVTGVVTYVGTAAGTWDGTIAVNDGTLNAASISLYLSNSNLRRSFMTIIGGTVAVSGTISMPATAARNQFNFTGAGLLQVGGNMTGGSFTQSPGCIVEFTSAGASNFNGYTFSNLKISGAGTKTTNGVAVVNNNLDITAGTLSGGAFNLSITNSASVTGTLTMAAGVLTIGGALTVDGICTITTGNLTVTGATLINGTGSIDNTSATGTNILGDITVTAGGTWNNTGNDAFTINGNLTNNSINFIAGTGTYTFAGAGKSIGGAESITLATASVTGTYTNNLLTPDYLYLNELGGFGDLTGTGTLTQAAGAELRIGDDAIISGVPGLDASANPNNVYYNGSGGQTVIAATYHHLTISKSAGTASVAGGAAGTVTVNGNLQILSGILALNTAGDIINVNAPGTTTITGASSVLNFSIAATTATLRDLTLSNGAEINRSGGTTGSLVSSSFVVNGTGGTVDQCNFTVTGVTTIDAPVIFDDNSGIKTFQGAVTINAAGTWTSTVIVTAANLVFQNGITNNGSATFNAASATFNTNTPQALDGTQTFTFIDAGPGVVVVNAPTVLTNNTTVSIQENDGNNALQGTGTWIQGANSTLNFTDNAITVTSMDASAAGNTVNYNGNNVGQTVYASAAGFDYWNLTASVSVTKTLGNTIDVLNALNVFSTATLATSLYTLNVSGSTFISGTLAINNAAGIANLQDVTLSGGAVNSGGVAATGTGNIATTLLADAGGGTIGRCNFNVTGTSTVNGPLVLNNDNGVKVFSDLVTVNATGSWNSTGIFTTPNLVFQNGIVSNGTAFSAADGTFNTRDQSISGATSVNFSDDVTISGAWTITNQVTTFIDINGDLTGSVAGSTWRNDPATRLNYAGAIQPMSTGVLDVSALNNVVNYDRANVQLIKVPLSTDYYHLELTVSNTKDFQGNTDVLGNLTVSGSVRADVGGAFTHNVSGTTYVLNTANLNLDNAGGVYNLTNLELTTTGGTNVGNSAGAAGTTNVSGTFLVTAGGTSTVTRCNFNVMGASTIEGNIILDDIPADVKTFTGPVTINATGNWTSTGITATGNLVFRGGIISNGTFFTAGGATFNTNPQTISGGTALGFANVVTVTGVEVTNNTIVNMTNTGGGTLTGAGGTWTQGASSALNYSGSTITIAAMNASAADNTVNYNAGVWQSVFAPSSGIYYHLALSNTAAKSLAAGFVTADINGNLSIQGTTQLDVNGKDITLAGNWDVSSTNVDPLLEGTRKVTFDGTSAQIISNTGDPQGTEFYDVEIANTSPTGVTLSGTAGNHLVIGSGGTLSLTDGYLYTSANNLVQIVDGAASTAGSATTFIDGPVEKTGTTAFIFPTGDDIAPAGYGLEDRWARIGISVTDLGGSNTMRAQYNFTAYADVTVDATLNNVSEIEYWTLDRIAGVDQVRISLYFEDASGSGITDYVSTDLVVARYNGADWTDMGQFSISGTDPGSVTSNYVGSFSPFSFGSKSSLVNPLPVELLSFTAILNVNVVDLAWITSSETNNDYFTLEKSSDGLNFETLTNVDGTGNSVSANSYRTTDDNPFVGINYYRLKQTDFDGTSTYSRIVAVEFYAGNGEPRVVIYPNPVKRGETLNIKLSGFNSRKEVLIVLLNTVGQIVFSKVIITGDNGYAVFAFDPSGIIPAGVYIITDSSDNRIYSRKVVIEEFLR